MPSASAIRDLPLRAGVSPAAGQTTQPSNSPTRPASANLGPWQLEGLIAEAAWCRVYRASHSLRSAASAKPAAASGKALYAVKVLHQRHSNDPLAISQLRVAATVGRCLNHPHVSPLVAAHVHRAPYYLVMPLLPGTTVSAALQASGKFRLPLALWITRQIAEGLAALHTLGYVHGDVRTAKILVGANGHATLLDLGCAQRANAEPNFDDRPLVGAIESLAPELHIGQSPTPKSDIYSLGLALFHMLAGRLPWRSRDAGVIAAWKASSQKVDVREFAPAVQAAVSRLVASLMAVEPLRRPNSAREVADELVRLEIATLGQQLSS